MTIDDRALVDRFLDMMAAEAGASPSTRARSKDRSSVCTASISGLSPASAAGRGGAGGRSRPARQHEALGPVPLHEGPEIGERIVGIAAQDGRCPLRICMR